MRRAYDRPAMGDDGETLDADASRAEHDRAEAREPRLVVVLRADRPLESPLAFGLAGVHRVRLGRGPRLEATRAGGVLGLSIPDRWMSSTHAELERLVDRWILRDAGSTVTRVANAGRDPRDGGRRASTVAGAAGPTSARILGLRTMAVRGRCEAATTAGAGAMTIVAAGTFVSAAIVRDRTTAVRGATIETVRGAGGKATAGNAVGIETVGIVATAGKSRPKKYLTESGSSPAPRIVSVSMARV